MLKIANDIRPGSALTLIAMGVAMAGIFIADTVTDYAIAAAVLGGCSLRGGEGSILGVVLGAAVMRLLYNSIVLLGIPSQLEFAIVGGVLLLGAVADEVVRRLAEARRARERARARTERTT